MELELVNERQNKLLSRKENNYKVIFDKATPKRQEITDAIAKKSGASTECISIMKIDNIRGFNEIKVFAYIYENKDLIPKLQKKGKKEIEKETKKGEK